MATISNDKGSDNLTNASGSGTTLSVAKKKVIAKLVFCWCSFWAFFFAFSLPILSVTILMYFFDCTVYISASTAFYGYRAVVLAHVTREGYG